MIKSSPSPPSSSRHRPKGLTLLYEDTDIIVIEKPSGLPSISTGRDSVKTVHSILNDYVRRGNPRSRNRVYIVHRLDRDTSGILVLAKSEAAKNCLQTNWQESEKKYLAVVLGIFIEKNGTLSSYLTENSGLTVYSTKNSANGKLSHTEYTVLKEARGNSLLRINLLTGRKHQIRVHMSECGHPVIGDKKYGSGGNDFGRLALHAVSLTFSHPVSNKKMVFETPLPDFVTRLVGAIL